MHTFLWYCLLFSSFVTAMQHADQPPLYDMKKTFAENVAWGPVFNTVIPTVMRPPREKWIDFLGYKVASRVGVPACAMTTSKGIALLSRLGFDIFTYKTIRSIPYASYPIPNIITVSVPNQLSLDHMPKQVMIDEGNCNDRSLIAVANSFGMGSFHSSFIKKDIQRAKNALLEGQLLIVSVFGETLKEFQAAALLAQSAGADVIELNFSCPNIRNEQCADYLNAKWVSEVAQFVTRSVSIPVIMKVGIFKDPAVMKEVFMTASRAGIRGVCGINTISLPVVKKDNDPAFGSARVFAGISGDPIRSLALDFVKQARKIVQEEKLNLLILGVGGITQPAHFTAFLSSGADAAMSATGVMWNPHLAVAYRKYQQNK